MSSSRWSVVIPAFNEAHRLPAYLDEVVAFFDGRGEPYEVIVVDDGSTDDTPRRVEAAARAHPGVRLLRSERNRGKGAAVKRGMLEAQGAFRLFTDADGATPIAELKRLEGALAAGAAIAIRPHRVAAGRLFNWMMARLGLRGIVDWQCGFKAFTASAAEHVFQRVRTDGFGFDVELLLLARAAGYGIAEVPVNWTDRAGSKSSVLRHGPGMVWQALRARLRTGTAD